MFYNIAYLDFEVPVDPFFSVLKYEQAITLVFSKMDENRINENYIYS